MVMKHGSTVSICIVLYSIAFFAICTKSAQNCTPLLFISAFLQSPSDQYTKYRVHIGQSRTIHKYHIPLCIR